MERWSGRVAVVTGASSGIGATIAQELVKQGLKVVGLARRVERVELGFGGLINVMELSRSIKSAKGKLYAVKCDVTMESHIKSAFKWVEENLGGVDILVNNAGVAIDSSLIDGSTEDLKKMLDLNVLALSMCTKEALQSMKENAVDDGHIIHINSTGGHTPPQNYFCMYSATKHAVTALTEGLRRELVARDSNIRVTSISPGLVKTDLPPKVVLEVSPYLNPEDIAGSVVYVLGTPQHVQIHELTILPVRQRL